ncbi:Transthyretin-like family protein [Cooperia oncophora]
MAVQGRSECFLVVGRLRCPTNPRKAVGVKIDLLDEDREYIFLTIALLALPFESDDLMGRTWSIYNGSFSVSGCGADFGPINTPDAYLRIEHSCPHRSDGRNEAIELDVLPIFMPRVVNLGSIYLDRYVNDAD